MDGSSGFIAPTVSSVTLITTNLQLPILVVIAPLMLWGVWLLSESSFEIFGTWTLPLRLSKKLRETSNQRDIRTHSVLINCAIGIALFVLIYVSIFVNPVATAPIIGSLVLLIGFIGKNSSASKGKLRQEKAIFEGELPTYMQLMTVLISSGISPARSIEILTRRSNSISGLRLREVVLDIRNGNSIIESLDLLSSRYESLVLRRFTTAISLGIERGSALTPILVAQVKDARVAQKNGILQRAGRAEIGLMIPVVFLILPISILFALWPSYMQLGDFL